jgi:hypothetical protein
LDYVSKARGITRSTCALEKLRNKDGLELGEDDSDPAVQRPVIL